MVNVVTKLHNLFVSYAQADAAWVHGVLFDALRAAGVDFHDEASFRLGVPKVAEFERAVLESERTLLVLSNAYFTESWAPYYEWMLLTYGIESSTWPIIPLLLESVDHLPPRLGMLTMLDATEPDSLDDVLARLFDALKRPVPGFTPPACPYPGVEPFTEKEQQAFFGRESEIADLVDRLYRDRFLAIIGPSGSGKSSLVQAGLVPALRQSDQFGPSEWVVHTLRPGRLPVAALASALQLGTAGSVTDTAPSASQSSRQQQILVVIDQFEEIFNSDQQEVGPFYATLQGLIDMARCFVVLTIRADFYAQIMRTPFWPLIQRNRYDLLPLDDKGLRDAIIKPAEARGVGVYIESALVERLMADAQREPGAVPLIQQILRLLWPHLERRFLPLRAYDALVLPRSSYDGRGRAAATGLQVAMERNGEDAFRRLPTAQHKAVAKRILLELVQPGEGRPDVRRQRSLAQLLDPRDDTAIVKETLDVLTEHRLITITGQEDSADRRVDLAHEALIQSWPTLRGWLEDVGRTDLILGRQLRQQAEEWDQQEGDEGLLYGGSRLADANGYAERHQADLRPNEKEFLVASAAGERARERASYLGQVAGGAVGVGLGFGAAFTLAFATTPLYAAAGANGPILLGVTFIFMFCIGQIVGLSIGLALWLWRNSRIGRRVAPPALGAVVGAATYLFYQRYLGVAPNIPNAAVGALLGLGPGLGVALSVNRWLRLTFVTVITMVAAVAAFATGRINMEPVTMLGFAAALGLLAGLGFLLTTRRKRRHMRQPPRAVSAATVLLLTGVTALVLSASLAGVAHAQSSSALITAARGSVTVGQQPLGVDAVEAVVGTDTYIDQQSEATLSFTGTLAVRAFQATRVRVESGPGADTGLLAAYRLLGGATLNTVTADPAAGQRVEVRIGDDVYGPVVTASDATFLVYSPPGTARAWMVVISGAATLVAGGVERQTPAGFFAYLPESGEPPTPSPAYRARLGQAFPALEDLTAGALHDTDVLLAPPVAQVGGKCTASSGTPAMASLVPTLPDRATLLAGKTNVWYWPQMLGDLQTVEQHQQCDVFQGDGVNVNETGKAVLNFQDAVQVQLYRASNLRYSADPPDPSCPTCPSLGMDLIQGFAQATVSLDTLKTIADARIGIRTGGWTSIMAVYTPHPVLAWTPSTQDNVLVAQSLGLAQSAPSGEVRFLVYYDGSTTLVLVQDGVVRVDTGAGAVDLHAGQFTSVDQAQRPAPPRPASRAQMGQFPSLMDLTGGELDDDAILAVTTPIRSKPFGGTIPSQPIFRTRFGIDEGFRAPQLMADTHAEWDRIVIAWPGIQPGGPEDFSGLGRTIPIEAIDADLRRGVRVAGVLQFTPAWAASDSVDGLRAVPRRLYAPFDSQLNYFGRFISEVVASYKDRIDEWIIWNDPDYPKRASSDERTYTWVGTDEEFAQLMKVGYLAAKRANPNAIVSFPGVSYWDDQRHDRALFYRRVLSILASDPDVVANNFYHDALALNLYENPDDILRVHDVLKRVQQDFGIDKPIWLSETNAMPADDGTVQCPRVSPGDIQTTMAQQGAFVVQAFALAAAAGYERVSFYKALDEDPCINSRPWGASRLPGDNPAQYRPVAQGLRVAITNFGGYTRATFRPLRRAEQNWSAWPDDPNSLTPNWQIYQVAFDHSGGKRVTALWNGDAAPVRVRIRANGTNADMMSLNGQTSHLQSRQGWWVVDLPGATARKADDEPGYYYIGGDPVLIIEDGVDPSRPVDQPELGDPEAATAGFDIAVVQTSGPSVDDTRHASFVVTTRARDGFSEPITFRVSEWSKEDVPPQDGGTLPLALTLPAALAPGNNAVVNVDASNARDGVYHLVIQANAQNVSRTLAVDIEVK